MKCKKMGKNRNKRQRVYNDKKIKRLTQKIENLNFKKKVVTSIIKPKKLTEQLPVPICDEYINMFGNKYPTSTEDLNDILEIILIQYNRLVKNETPDQQLLENIKKSTLNLCRIVNYFVYDNELIKLLRVLDMIDDKSYNDYHYLKTELDNIQVQLKRSEHKVYLLLINRLKNSNIQSRYIESYKKHQTEKIEKVENELLFDEDTEKVFFNNVLADLDNLII